MLMFGIIVILLACTALMVLQQQCWQQGDLTALALPTDAEHSTVPAKTSGLVPVLLLALLLSAISVGIYAKLGRYGEHQHQTLNTQLDYVLRERLQTLAQQASTPVELEQLAFGYAELGQYDQAAATMARLLDLSAASSRNVALQAKFSYYRDGRVINADTQLLISRSLALNPAEPEALLLLANHAYLHGEYAQAIDHWQTLLQAAPVGLELAPIHRAMAKAEAKLAAAAQK